MAKLNHKNLGEVQKTAYLTAKVVSTDSENDTMKFTGIGKCPDATACAIFYHCQYEEGEEPAQRDNGALEGASGAFAEDDEVIVQCEILDSTEYKPLYVIGFTDKPKQCKVERVYVEMSRGATQRCFVWDASKDEYAEIELNAGGLASFPCDPADISDWVADQDSVGENLFDEVQCGRNRIYTSCPWADWGTTNSSSDAHNEPSACACDLVDIASRECECDASIKCYWHPPQDWWEYSGYLITTIQEHIAAYGDGWQLTALNNSEVVTNFRQEWQDSLYRENYSIDGVACNTLGAECNNFTGSTTEQITKNFHCPLEQNILENTNDKTSGYDYCGDTTYSTETSGLISKMRLGAQFTDDIIAQIYTVENNTYSDSGGWAGLSLEVRAQAGVFQGDSYPDGTDKIDPTGLSRNGSFESAVNSIYADLLSEFPERVVLEANLSLIIYKG